jgi:hypothetical protein
VHDDDAAILRLPGPIRRDLLLLVAAKLAALALLYWACFSPSHQPRVDVLRHIAGPLSAR